MSISAHSDVASDSLVLAPLPARRIDWSREWLPLTGLLAISLLVRLPYLSHNVFIGDSVNYCIAALDTWVAHPPGYVGFCLLGRMVNVVVGNINTSFILINLVATVVAIVLCYIVARLVGLDRRASLVATALFSFSVSVMYFSNVALNHNTESMCVLAFAAVALVAMRERSMKWALAASAVIALTGAIRPNTVAYLVPLWIYVIVKSRPPNRSVIAYWAAHVAVAAPILFAWLYTNSVLMDRAGYGGKTFDLQVMMPSAYEYADLKGDVKMAKLAAPSYHMPGFEILSWIDRKLLHTKVLPHKENWPEPNIVRALKLSAVQTGKLAYFMLFSVPMLAALPLLLIVRRRNFKNMGATLRNFFLIWFIPPMLFFMFGHLGSFGYMHIFLSGITLFLCLLIFGREDSRDAQTDRPIPANPTWLYWAAATPALLCIIYFVVARPTRATGGAKRLADILMLQYTGAGIRQGYSTARASQAKDDYQIPAGWRRARNDAELLEYAKESQFSPVPRFDQPQQMAE